MNILIINGSPRKKGLISQMLDIMREEAKQRGDEVQTVATIERGGTAMHPQLTEKDKQKCRKAIRKAIRKL